MKKTIRLTESELRNIIKESVKTVLNEVGDTLKGQKKLGGLQARKVINANGGTIDDFFNTQTKEGGKIYQYAKQHRSESGSDSDMYGNTINPLYKEYCDGYIDYLNSHPDEIANRNERLRKLGYSD